MDPAGRFPPPAPYPRRRGAFSLMGGHHSNGASKKEGTKSVVGGIRGRAYYFRRCKKVPASNIESLPDEVLIEILVRLSVEEILENARFVCRHWYRIIHSDAFVKAHLHHHYHRDDWGLLLTGLHVKEHPLFLCVRHGRIEVSKLYEECFSPIPASCNGLVLLFEKLFTIYFVNLATKQAFSSPPSRPHSNVFYCTFGMAYAAASMEYKVVRAYTSDSIQTLCHILTAGVDNNWRSVGVDHLSCGAKKLLLLKTPLITQGFMHWTWEWEGTRVLTFNAETEMFTESYVPILPHPVDDEDKASAHKNGKRKRRGKFFVSTGRRLCLFSVCGDWVWEVWEMEEGERGEWIKLLPNIDLEAHDRRVKQVLPSDNTSSFLEPLGWVKYPVLLALYYGRTCFVYNLATDEIDYSIELPHPRHYCRAVAHRNTLEWLRHCTSLYEPSHHYIIA